MSPLNCPRYERRNSSYRNSSVVSAYPSKFPIWSAQNRMPMFRVVVAWIVSIRDVFQLVISSVWFTHSADPRRTIHRNDPSPGAVISATIDSYRPSHGSNRATKVPLYRGREIDPYEMYDSTTNPVAVRSPGSETGTSMCSMDP